jgi:uncharacterized iron-regulated membrane protein
MHRDQTTFAQRRSLFWRIHFWAALIASPFALLATLTGILYIFTPQVEAKLYGHLEQVAPSGTMLPLDQLVDIAKDNAPAGLVLHSVVPPFAASDVLKLTFSPPGKAAGGHEGHQHAGSKAATSAPPAFGAPSSSVVLYLHPYTGQVLGSLAPQERFGNWAKKLHSSLLQNDGWRWMIELAASWLMVMLLTGVWLWWPRNGAKVLPSGSARGRAAWRQWHAFLGVVFGVMSLIILATGLTWSKYAGDQIRHLRDVTGQASPQAPADLRSAHSEQPQLGWQAAWDVARIRAPQLPLLLTPPADAHGVWKVGASDRSQPAKRFDLLLDAYSGQTLYYAGWDKQTAFGKATAVGIPFHRGEFGWWNQALLLVFGLGILFSLVSGWVMYLKRRKPGSLALPPLPAGAWRSASPAAWLSALGLCALMPLLAVSAAALIVLEIILAASARKQPAAAPIM